MNIKDIEMEGKVYSTLLANISQAFAYKKNVRKEIDKLYEKFKVRAYKKATKSIAYTSDVMTYGSLEDEIYRKKALGLILLGEEDEVIKKKLLAIIKRNFGKLYSVIISKKEEAFIEYMTSIIINTGEDDPNYRKATEYLIVYLIIKCFEYDNINGLYKDFLNNILETVKSMNKHSLINMNTETAIKENKKIINSILNRISENRGYYSCYEDIFNTDDEDIKRYETMITMLFDFEKLSISNLLSSVKLKEKDINEILLPYAMVYKDKNLERTTNLLINGIIIKSLLKAYKSVKGMYFKNNKETLYLDFEKLNGSNK
ncbi:MAG: hypothetical protein FH753_11095 [Firmicutes bacterium]|nr:hypothetical protein [Bacillota bacterium]